MLFAGKFTNEDDPRISKLRDRMDSFYQNTPEYVAFQEINELPDQWPHVRTAILTVLKNKPVCRVLEFGAGRTGFTNYIKDIRDSVRFTSQDVTHLNEDHLRDVADEVHVGSIADLHGEFDIILSTFAFEHISDPRRTLEKLYSMLSAGGKIFIFCPRYDAPFYIGHSADHYNAFVRLMIAFFFIGARLWTIFTGRPLFLIHTDPAIFHLPYFRDRDAIHWASLWDLRAYFRGKATVKSLNLPFQGSKDWIVKNLLQINVVITRLE